MTPPAKSRASTSTRAPREPVVEPAPGAGAADVTQALRQLVRGSRDLLTDAGDVLDRELAMAISISERLRDEAVSAELLAEARGGRLNASLRDSAHRVTDLVADVGGVASLLAVRFGERLADEPRLPLARVERPGGPRAAGVAAGA